MSIIQKIAQKAADIVRMCCYSASDIAELQRLVSSVRAEDLKYNAELALGFGGSLPSFWPKFAQRKQPCIYTEIYSDDLMNLCIFCLPAGSEIPLHDHPGMYGLLKVIEGSCLVESFTSTGKTANSPMNEDVVPVRVHEPVLLSSSDPASLFTPTIRNYHRVSSRDSPAAFFDVLFPPYKSPDRDCHYFSLKSRCPRDAHTLEDHSFGLLLPCNPKSYQCEVYPYEGSASSKSADQSCEKAVPCPLHACRKTFPNEKVAQKHIQVHRSRVHVCNICGKAFSSASKLKRHQVVHSREKQFQCEIPGCSKRFTLPFNLKRHMKTHTGQTKPYSCSLPECGLRFTTLSALNNHVLRKHPHNN